MNQPNPAIWPANSRQGVHRSALQKTLLAAGFSGVVFFSVFTILGALAPSYSFARDTISSLEFTPMSVAQRANFFIFGLLLWAFAAALRRELGHGRGALLIPLFQTFSGIGVIGDAIFIHDPLHLVCDLIAFNSALLVLFTFAWRFWGDRQWKGWSAYSLHHRDPDDGASRRLRSCQPPWRTRRVAGKTGRVYADFVVSPSRRQASRRRAS